MRAQLINDAFGLSQATEVPADLALKLVGYLCNETDYLPWNVFLSRSKFYTDMLDHTKYGDNIQKYFAKLTNLYYSKFNTWHGNDTSNETWLDRQIKTNFIQFACFRGQSDCVRQAKDYFSQAKKSNDLTKIPALFRPTVYCIGIREGTNEDFDFLFNQYNTLGKSNKTEIFYGLSCSKDLSQLSRCLSEATNPNNDINFTLQAIRNVSVRPNGNSLSWSYIKSNWDSLYEKSSVSGLTSLITDITNKFNNQDQYDDFVSFFSRNKKAKIENAVLTASLRIKSFVNWYRKSTILLDEWSSSL